MPTTPLDAEAALLAILDRCRADSSCGARFGDPQADYRALRAWLRTASAIVSGIATTR